MFRASEVRELEEERWQAVLDTLLEWFQEAPASRGGTVLETHLRSAIDFAVDHRDYLPVPASVGLTDDDGVCFEWRVSDEVTTIEVVSSGVAELTRFRGARVIEETLLRRDPQTRRLVPSRDA